MAPVVVRSLSRLCPSLLCTLSMFVFSFPLPEGLGLISLRASSLDSVCVSERERTVSVADGGGGGDEGGEGGEGGASERELCAFSGRTKSLNRGYLLVVKLSKKRFLATYLTFGFGTEVAEVLRGPCCAPYSAPCSAPCFTDIELSLLGRILLRPSVFSRVPPPRVPSGVGASLQSIGVGCSAAPSALPLLWLTLDTACCEPCAPPVSPSSFLTDGRGPSFSSSLALRWDLIERESGSRYSTPVNSKDGGRYLERFPCL